MSNLRQAWKTGILTFFLSITISSLSSVWATSFAFYYSIIPLLLVIGVGILFDIIGTAVTAAHETPFHAMAADKVFGAKQAIWLVRRADRVANFCNDVVGDICGTASGSLNAVLIIEVSSRFARGLNTDLFSVISLGLVAAITVGGKAWGKSTAINGADRIIFKVGQALATWDSITGKKHESGRKPKNTKAKKRNSSRK